MRVLSQHHQTTPASVRILKGRWKRKRHHAPFLLQLWPAALWVIHFVSDPTLSSDRRNSADNTSVGLSVRTYAKERPSTYAFTRIVVRSLRPIFVTSESRLGPIVVKGMVFHVTFSYIFPMSGPLRRSRYYEVILSPSRALSLK